MGKNGGAPAQKIFVTFDKASSKKKCLREEKGKLGIKGAPSQCDIIWGNIGITDKERNKMAFVANFLALAIVGSMTAIIMVRASYLNIIVCII